MDTFKSWTDKTLKEMKEDFKLKDKEIDQAHALLLEAREALRSIGNTIGGPVTDYSPQVAMQEFDRKNAKAIKTISATLSKLDAYLGGEK